MALVALIVRVGPKDRVVGFSTIYYGAPLVVIAGLFVLAGLFWWRDRRWAIGGAAFVLGAVCGIVWYARTHYEHSRTRDEKAIRLAVWNAARPRKGAAVLAGRLLDKEPDIAVFVESGDLETAGVRRSVTERFEGYRSAAIGGGVTVFARGAIRRRGFHELGRRNRLVLFTVELARGSVEVAVADLTSNPFTPRRTAFEMLRDVVGSADPPPDAIVGDFNTPADSVWFAPLRRNYARAFETAGTGRDATWPRLLPLIAIDHIWVRNEHAAHHADIVPLRGSDHRAVVAEVRMDDSEDR